MSTPGELAFPRWNIEAKTADELNSIATPDGLRRWLRSRRSCPIIHSVFRLAEIEGWSGEEVYARLAYHALVSLEKLQDEYMAHLNRCANPTLLTTSKRDGG